MTKSKLDTITSSITSFLTKINPNAYPNQTNGILHASNTLKQIILDEDVAMDETDACTSVLMKTLLMLNPELFRSDTGHMYLLRCTFLTAYLDSLLYLLPKLSNTTLRSYASDIETILDFLQKENPESEEYGRVHAIITNVLTTEPEPDIVPKESPVVVNLKPDIVPKEPPVPVNLKPDVVPVEPQNILETIRNMERDPSIVKGVPERIQPENPQTVGSVQPQRGAGKKRKSKTKISIKKKKKRD